MIILNYWPSLIITSSLPFVKIASSNHYAGSVHSVKMTFVGVQDSDDEEEGKRYN